MCDRPARGIGKILCLAVLIFLCSPTKDSAQTAVGSDSDPGPNSAVEATPVWRLGWQKNAARVERGYLRPFLCRRPAGEIPLEVCSKPRRDGGESTERWISTSEG